MGGMVGEVIGGCVIHRGQSTAARERVHQGRTRVGDPVSPHPVSRRRTALYVNGDPDSRILMRRLSRRWPTVTLRTVDTGSAALRAAELTRPDTVVIDDHLSDGSGLDVLIELRARPLTSQIPVAFLNSDPSPGRRERLLRAGASAFITKPLNLAEVDRTVRCLLGLPV